MMSVDHVLRHASFLPFLEIPLVLINSLINQMSTLPIELSNPLCLLLGLCEPFMCEIELHTLSRSRPCKQDQRGDIQKHARIYQGVCVFRKHQQNRRENIPTYTFQEKKDASHYRYFRW